MPWEIVKPGTRIDFIGKRHLAALVSALVLIASVAAVFLNGVRLGIDFAGGTEVQLAFAPGVEASDGAIRDVLSSALEIEEASVVRYGEEGDNEFLIKFKGTINEETGGVEGLPPLRSRYPLTPEQIERFRADGHLLLRGVCTHEEIDVFGDAITAAVSAAAAPGRGAAPGFVPPGTLACVHVS